MPREQQPVFELSELREDRLMQWAEKPWPELLSRLALVYMGALSDRYQMLVCIIC